MVDTDILYQMLEWVVKGGAGPISQWICEHWTWLQRQTSRVKLILALAVSSVVGAAAYAIAVVMLYQPAPTDWRGWVVALVSAAVLSSGFSQIVHRLGRK